MREMAAEFLIRTGLTLAVLAPIVLVIEIVEWVLTGTWPGWSLEDGLLFVGIEAPLAYFDLTQFILDLIIDLPLAIGLYLIGLLVFRLALDAVDPV
jgi:hypothetical protein